jgi:prenyltransferase beta subunit
MSLRLQMLRAARQARRLRPDLADGARQFLRAIALESGAFPDRSGKADLYYTVFGLLGLLATEPDAGLSAVAASAAKEEAAGDVRQPPADILRADASSPPPSPIAYLRTFTDAAALDLVHVACLARCWALAADNLQGATAREARLPDAATRAAILTHVERHRSADGGYNATACASAGTAYGAFLALGAYQDLDAPLPDAAGLARATRSLRTPDGAYANEPAAEQGSTPATAAAAMILAELGESIDAAALGWMLERAAPGGGFFAMPVVPIPDLLSTATALHALAAAGVAVDTLRDTCMPFIEGLRSGSGGFRGHALDDDADAEYTFYGLLALGHLAGPD